MSGMNSIYIVAFLALVGCGDTENSPEPPNRPQLLPGASAVCESVRQQATDDNGSPLKVLRLVLVRFQAQDLDGATTLEAPTVTFGGTTLQMGEPVPTAEQPVECEVDTGACRVEYTWNFSEQKNPLEATPGMGVGDILCGPGGDQALFKPAPFLEVEIYDNDGWSSKGNLPLGIAD